MGGWPWLAEVGRKRLFPSLPLVQVHNLFGDHLVADGLSLTRLVDKHERIDAEISLVGKEVTCRNLAQSVG